MQKRATVKCRKGLRIALLSLVCALTFLFCLISLTGGGVSVVPFNANVGTEFKAQTPVLNSSGDTKTIKITSTLSDEVKTLAITLDNENNSYIKYYELLGGRRPILNKGNLGDYYLSLKNKKNTYYNIHKNPTKQQGYFIPQIDPIPFASYFYPDVKFVNDTADILDSSSKFINAITINGKSITDPAYTCHCVKESKIIVDGGCYLDMLDSVYGLNIYNAACGCLEFPSDEDITIHLDIVEVVNIDIQNLISGSTSTVSLNDCEFSNNNYTLILNSLLHPEVLGEDFKLFSGYDNCDFQVTNAVSFSTNKSGLTIIISAKTVANKDVITIDYTKKSVGESIVDGVGGFFGNLFGGISGVFNWFKIYGKYVLIGLAVLAAIVVVALVVKFLCWIFK